MTFTDYEKNLLETKPRFLNSAEKKIRAKLKRKIEYDKNKEKYLDYYQDNKEKYQDYRDTNKQKKDEPLIRVIIAPLM
jgi:hypothetical protein